MTYEEPNCAGTTERGERGGCDGHDGRTGRGAGNGGTGRGEHDEHVRDERDGRGARREIGTRAISRRALCAGVGSMIALAAVGGAGIMPAEAVTRPPGGLDAQRMIARCIRCQRCYEVCKRRVIKPAHLESGLAGMRMPTMSFDVSYCDFCADENDGTPLCAQCCPTGALDLAEALEAEEVGIGCATITREWCLAYQLNGCRFCFDACPYDAIVLDELHRPSVVAERCNGCGACEAACVSLKEGSISIGATARAITVLPAHAKR